MLTSIDQYCGGSTTGLDIIEYAPVSWIDAASYEEIITESNQFAFPILFSTGAWLRMPAQFDKNDLSQVLTLTDQGVSFSTNINAILPRMLPSVTGELHRMCRQRFVIRLTDGTGQVWVIGKKENGVKFEFRQNMGSVGTLRNYSIVWSGSEATPLAGYNY